MCSRLVAGSLFVLRVAGFEQAAVSWRPMEFASIHSLSPRARGIFQNGAMRTLVEGTGDCLVNDGAGVFWFYPEVRG